MMATMCEKEPELGQDPTAGADFHRPDDRFIPVRVADLVEALARDESRFGIDAEALRTIARGIEDVVEQEVGAYERSLRERYAAYNPDRDTMPLADVEPARTDDGYAALNARLDYLYTKANFRQLTEQEIEEALQSTDAFGLRVRLRPDRVSHLTVWVRGQGRTERTIRHWRHPIRGVPRTLPTYRRMGTVTRLKDSAFVNLKLFKEIPVTGVEALLPNAYVQMSWIDRLKVMGGGAGVLGSTATKLLKLPLALAYASKLLWVILAGSAVLAYRAFMGYRNVRVLRDSERTRHLYYQTLDSNAGVIHMLCAMIAQEEIKEALLAYCFCLRDGNRAESAEALDRMIEGYIQEKFRAKIDFDIRDALESLDRFDLWSDRDRLLPKAPESAAAILRSHWCDRRTEEYHEGRAIASET